MRTKSASSSLKVRERRDMLHALPTHPPEAPRSWSSAFLIAQPFCKSG